MTNTKFTPKQEISTRIMEVTANVTKHYLSKKIVITSIEDRKQKDVVWRLINRYLNVGHNDYVTITFQGLKSFMISYIPAFKEMGINLDYLTDDLIKSYTNDVTQARLKVIEEYRVEYPEVVKKFSKIL